MRGCAALPRRPLLCCGFPVQVRRLSLPASAEQPCSALLRPLVLDHLRVRALAGRLLVEVLELGKVPPLRDQRGDRRRVLADAVPAARRVADAVLGVVHPVLGLLGDVHDLEDPHEAVLGRVHLLEQLRVQLDAGLDVVVDRLVQEGLRHHRGRRAVLVEAELLAERVGVAAVVGEDRVADARQVRGLAHVVPVPACPHQDVVSEVTLCLV
mmetsp:Transcript_66853/g.172123  ORF Transcript_66853/g.172123 Transcript_66853/m.172123 type:complete len:211 (-) Transcript_66853:1832-2464(-)